MDVREMRMPMHDAGVRVDVGVRLARGVARTMSMLVVSVVRMPMLVGHGLMDVLVRVLLDQVEV